MLKREPLNSTVEAITRRQNGQIDGVMRNSILGLGVQVEQVTEVEAHLDLHGVVADPVAADVVGAEGLRRQAVGVEPAGAHPVEPAGLDDVDPTGAALSEEPLAILGTRRRHGPDAASADIAWKPEHRHVTRVDAPHHRRVVGVRRGRVRSKHAERRVLAEVPDRELALTLVRGRRLACQLLLGVPSAHRSQPARACDDEAMRVDGEGTRSLRTALQPWVRRLAWTHAATRAVIGVTALIAPATFGRPWLGGDIDRGGGKVAFQAFAVRDAALGVGILHSLATGQPVRKWFRLGLAFELRRRRRNGPEPTRAAERTCPRRLRGARSPRFRRGAIIAFLLDEDA